MVFFFSFKDSRWGYSDLNASDVFHHHKVPITNCGEEWNGWNVLDLRIKDVFPKSVFEKHIPKITI